jgi:hypothetical protein
MMMSFMGLAVSFDAWRSRAAGRAGEAGRAAASPFERSGGGPDIAAMVSPGVS